MTGQMQIDRLTGTQHSVGTKTLNAAQQIRTEISSTTKSQKSTINQFRFKPKGEVNRCTWAQLVQLSTKLNVAQDCSRDESSHQNGQTKQITAGNVESTMLTISTPYV